MTRFRKVAKMAILQSLYYSKMVKNGGTRNFLYLSLLTSSAGGKGKETTRHDACANVFAH